MTADLELFKQALNEGLELRIQSTIDSCTEEIVCSKEHIAACKAIIRGTYKNRPLWSDAKIKIAAIIAAATMLLAGCTAIYKDEIKTFIKHIYEEYIEITFGESGSSTPESIEEIYELTYVPEGYALKKSTIDEIIVGYTYISSTGEEIIFGQQPLSAYYGFDNENGYSSIIVLENYEVFCKKSDLYSTYLWSNGKYSLSLTTSEDFTEEELIKIINGIQPK